ncbi:hypothetical protein ACHMW6_00665 [Pseudoduganella sp. UC29_106]|uniref:hypothetical protein n=1 Tax=Pseudoduganella sp. UC29_106 TaxID=3374553 RepID=UPI003757CA59
MRELAPDELESVGGGWSPKPPSIRLNVDDRPRRGPYVGRPQPVVVPDPAGHGGSNGGGGQPAKPSQGQQHHYELPPGGSGKLRTYWMTAHSRR